MADRLKQLLYLGAHAGKIWDFSILKILSIDTLTFDTQGTGIARSGVHGSAVLDKRCHAEVGLYKWLGGVGKWQFHSCHAKVKWVQVARVVD